MVTPEVVLDSTPLSLDVAGVSIPVVIETLSGNPQPTLSWSLIIDGAAAVPTTATGADLNWSVTVPENDGSYDTLSVVVTATNSEGTDTDTISVTVEV